MAATVQLAVSIQNYLAIDIVIKNNLVYDVSTSYSTAGNPANGWFAVIGNGPRDITIDHNTVDNDGNDTIVFYEASGAPATRGEGALRDRERRLGEQRPPAE